MAVSWSIVLGRRRDWREIRDGEVGRLIDFFQSVMNLIIP